MKITYSIQEIRGAVARGWCDEKNSSKEMDSDLAEAISQEVRKMLDGPVTVKEAATLDELNALLNSEDDSPIEINPDGSIRPL